MATIWKYLNKLFWPMCAGGWVLALVGGISSGKNSLLLLIGTVVFLLPVAVFFCLFIINLLTAAIERTIESKRSAKGKRVKTIIVSAFIVLTTVALLIAYFQSQFIENILTTVENQIFNLFVLGFCGSMLLALGYMFLISLSNCFVGRKNERISTKLYFAAASFLALIGGTGFLAGFLACTGWLNWIPNTVELPLAVLAGMDIDEKGNLYTASEFYSRVQVYDAKGNYVHGWFIAHTGGGALKIRVNKTNEIEVITARGNNIFVFDENGNLLRSSQFDDDFSYWESFVQKGKHLHNEKTGTQYDTHGWIFPRIIQRQSEHDRKIGKNSFYLLPFQGPFQGWALFAGGLIIGSKAAKRKKKC